MQVKEGSYYWVAEVWWNVSGNDILGEVDKRTWVNLGEEGNHAYEQAGV